MIRASLAAGVRIVEAGYSTVVEGVIGPWHWDLVLDEVGPVLESVSYVVLRPTLQVCLERAGGRTDRVPGQPALRDPSPIKHMWEQFSELGSFEGCALDSSTLDEESTEQAVIERLASGANLVAGHR